jgi:hypothetical protein
MSAKPGKWYFMLADSGSMEQLGILKAAAQKQVQFVFNRPGSLTFRLPIDDRMAYRIRNRSTCVIAFRNNRAVWSGPVVNIVDSLPDDTVQISCSGWLEELDHRYIRPSEESGLIFSGQPGGYIIQQLISKVNNQLDGLNSARPTHLSPGVYSDTQARDRSYKRAENYGEKIRELSDVENGCDIFVDPLSRVVNAKGPTEFTDRLEVRFGYGTFPNNLESVSRTIDGSRIANRITVAGGAGTTTGFAESQDAMDDTGIMLEEWITLSDVTQTAILSEYANGEVAYKKYGVTTFAIKPMAVGNVPRLFDDFDLGDRVYFSVNRGRFQVDMQAVRVFTATVDISDETGDEIWGEIGTSPS